MRPNFCIVKRNPRWGFSCFLGFGNLHHDGAFDSLFEELTAVFIDAVDIARCVVCVCGATAGAVKLCPAILAFGSCVRVAGAEFILYGSIGYAVPNVTEAGAPAWSSVEFFYDFFTG